MRAKPPPPNQAIRKPFICQRDFEGSAEERTVLEKAEAFSCKREKAELPPGDVDLVLSDVRAGVGEDFELTLKFVNRSGAQRTVEAYVSGSVVYYTGLVGSEFLFETPSVKMEPAGRKEDDEVRADGEVAPMCRNRLFSAVAKETVSVEAKLYMKALVEQSNLHFIVTGKVTETGQIISAMKLIRLRGPALTVKVRRRCRRRRAATARPYAPIPHLGTSVR